MAGGAVAVHRSGIHNPQRHRFCLAVRQQRKIGTLLRKISGRLRWPDYH